MDKGCMARGQMRIIVEGGLTEKQSEELINLFTNVNSDIIRFKHNKTTTGLGVSDIHKLDTLDKLFLGDKNKDTVTTIIFKVSVKGNSDLNDIKYETVPMYDNTRCKISKEWDDVYKKVEEIISTEYTLWYLLLDVTNNKIRTLHDVIIDINPGTDGREYTTHLDTWDSHYNLLGYSAMDTINSNTNILYTEMIIYDFLYIKLQKDINHFDLFIDESVITNMTELCDFIKEYEYKINDNKLPEDIRQLLNYTSIIDDREISHKDYYENLRRYDILQSLMTSGFVVKGRKSSKLMIEVRVIDKDENTTLHKVNDLEIVFTKAYGMTMSSSNELVMKLSELDYDKINKFIKGESID